MISGNSQMGSESFWDVCGRQPCQWIAGGTVEDCHIRTSAIRSSERNSRRDFPTASPMHLLTFQMKAYLPVAES